MAKSHLVAKMAKDAGISRSVANPALNAIIDGITKDLKKKDGKGTLVGFGTFSKVRCKASKGRKPHRPARKSKSRHPMLLGIMKKCPLHNLYVQHLFDFIGKWCEIDLPVLHDFPLFRVQDMQHHSPRTE